MCEGGKGLSGIGIMGDCDFTGRAFLCGPGILQCACASFIIRKRVNIIYLESHL